MLLKALTESREELGLRRGHMALGQWIKMGEHDNYGIAFGAWGECAEQHLGIGIIGKLVRFLTYFLRLDRTHRPHALVSFEVAQALWG